MSAVHELVTFALRHGLSVGDVLVMPDEKIEAVCGPTPFAGNVKADAAEMLLELRLITSVPPVTRVGVG